MSWGYSYKRNMEALKRSTLRARPALEMEGSIIKAIVCSVTNGPYEIKDVRIETMLDDEIAVRMVATGVCHTDFACTNVNNHAQRPHSFFLGSLANLFISGHYSRTTAIDCRPRRCRGSGANWVKGEAPRHRRPCAAII